MHYPSLSIVNIPNHEPESKPTSKRIMDSPVTTSNGSTFEEKATCRCFLLGFSMDPISCEDVTSEVREDKALITRWYRTYGYENRSLKTAAEMNLVVTNYQIGKLMHKSALEIGLPQACTRVGECYQNGLGVEESCKLAAYWCRKSTGAHLYSPIPTQATRQDVPDCR
ncbi:hypothetical protein AAMO2058_000177800 [Amorphochlora amoebiformis]